MVLICNNNILTIEKFHKHRCAEKQEIQNIIINEKKLDEKYKETPPKEVDKHMSYIASTEGYQMKQKKSITLSNYNCTRW